MKRILALLSVLLLLSVFVGGFAVSADDAVLNISDASEISEVSDLIDASDVSGISEDAEESKPKEKPPVPSGGVSKKNFSSGIAFVDKLYDTFILTGNWKLIVEGLGNTAVITLGALVIGVLIGTFIAVVKYFSDDSRVLKPIAKVCDWYVTLIRGLPVTVLLLIFYYIIYVSADDGRAVATLTFGINSGAYMAELIRSGINAVDRGQMEAGRSLGMSKLQTMRKIIFPQAIRYILPAIGNEFVALLKETSVAGYVAVTDLTRAGNLVRNNTYDSVSALLVVAVIYLAIVICLTQLLKLLERRLAKSDKR